MICYNDLTKTPRELVRDNKPVALLTPNGVSFVLEGGVLRPILTHGLLEDRHPLFCFLLVLLTRYAWEDGKEDATLTRNAAYSYFPTLGLDDAPSEGKAQARSLLLLGGIGI